MKIKVIKDRPCVWYKLGEIYTVKDWNRYDGIGVQVLKDGNGHTPDVIMDGDYELVN